MVWTALEVVFTYAGTAADSQGEVEFIAHFQCFGKVGCLHERSRFIKEEGRWFYQDCCKTSLLQGEDVRQWHESPLKGLA